MISTLTVGLSSLLALTLTCPEPKVTGGTPDPVVYERAVEVCATYYAGCMVEIRKTGDYSYKVICKRHDRQGRWRE